MFVMSNQEQKMDALLKVMTELAKTMQRNSSYDGLLGAARASRGKRGTEHKQRLPEEEFRIRNHFIDSLRHVQMQEVKERHKLAKHISEEEKRLSKTVRKHAKADSEASKNLRHLHRVVGSIGDVLQQAESVWKKHNDAIRTHAAEYRKQQAQYEKINSSFTDLVNHNIDTTDLAKLKKTLAGVGNMLPKSEIDTINQRIVALSKALGASNQDTIDKTFNAIIQDLGTITANQTKQLEDEFKLKIKDNLRLRKGLLNEEQHELAMRRERILNFSGTIDAIKKVEGDLTSGIGRFADMFGKDKLVNKFSKDANEAIVKFKDTLKALTTATDPKEIKKLDNIARAQSGQVFSSIRRFEERIAKLRDEQGKGFFKDLKEKFSMLVTKIEDGVETIKEDPAAAGGMLMDKLGDLFGGILGKVAGGVQFLIEKAASVVMKEIVPDRLALMKYGTFLTGSGGNGLEWTENLKLASRMGMKSTELAQMRAEQRALLLTSSGGEARVLDSIGDIVYGISKEGRGTSLGKGKDPMGHYFGGSTQDRVEASLAGLTMLRNSGIVSSFENLGNMMEQYTIENQNITGLTQQQLFTYASDIMNLSDNQELLSGATEEQQKAMLANTFKLQQVYAGLGYSAEESKALTEEMARMRKGMSGKDKLRSLATVPMMGSMMGLNQTQMSFLQGATEANAKGSVAFEQFMAQNGNVEILKGINTSFQGILQGNQGLMQKILFEELLSKIPEFQQIMSFAPGSAKQGVTKTDVSNRNRMTANTVIEDKAIMTLDASLKSWNDGMLHGVLSMRQVSDSFASIAKSVDATGSSLGPMLTTASNGISALIKYLNIGHLFDSAELTERISKANAFSESVNAVASMGKDKRGFFGKLVPFKDPKWNYSASEFDTLTDAFVRLYAPDSTKRGNKSVHLTSSTRDYGDFALNNKGQYVWTSQGNYNATQIQDITNAMRQLVVDKAEEEKKKAEAEENALRDSESKLIESNDSLKGSIDKLKVAVDDNNKVRGGAQSTAPVTPPPQPGKPGGVQAPTSTASPPRSPK